MVHLIIGNGVAGLSAALAIRKNKPGDDISIISESKYLHYYRPRLIEYLADDVSLDQMTIYKPDFYEKNNIKNILDTKIVSISSNENSVTDSNDKKYNFDNLLIAIGGNPFVPPLENVNLKGVFTLRGVTDSDNIKKYCKNIKKAFIMGAGLLGLETAGSLSKAGVEVTVIERNNWLLHRQLDEDGGKILQQLLEKKGINFIVNDKIASIDGIDKVEKVTLESGKEINTEMVIISSGITCNPELAKNSNIDFNKGIIVNDNMQTSYNNIYAAGDIAEHNGSLYGIWPAAKDQGTIAGLNMAGVPTDYKGTIRSNVLKISGIDLYSAGDVHDKNCEVFVSVKDNIYKKLLMMGDKSVGTIVLGDSETLKVAKKVMEGKTDPGEMKKLI